MLRPQFWYSNNCSENFENPGKYQNAFNLLITIEFECAGESCHRGESICVTQVQHTTSCRNFQVRKHLRHLVGFFTNV